MRILYIYRNPAIGFSIGRVFHPIEQAMKQNCEVESFYLPASGYRPKDLWRNISSLLKFLRKKRYDIIHITGSEHYLLPFLRKYKTVMTVHDFGFLVNIKWGFRFIWRYILWIKTLKLATKVTFISEKSHLEAKHFIRFKIGQDSVIYNPIGKEFSFKPKSFNSTCPVILHMGTKSNKNLNNTIIALKDFSCELRIIGNLTDRLKQQLQDFHIKYTNAYNLSDEEIVLEYEKCDIVNFPSFYEGFGMPIIEGQAVGRVIVTSNLSPMKEIAADGAVLVDPTNVNSIKLGYKEAVGNYEIYVRKGLENVKRFSLDHIVQSFYSIYKELYDKR